MLLKSAKCTLYITVLNVIVFRPKNMGFRPRLSSISKSIPVPNFGDHGRAILFDLICHLQTTKTDQEKDSRNYTLTVNPFY